MGQKSGKITKQWADGPFKQIESPAFKAGIKRDPSKESGAYSCANEMTLVHNVLIKTLNCVYLQAPNITKEKDISDFLTFMHSWSLFLHMHHDTEESVIFPLFESRIGIPGFMEKNVEQHQSFVPGVGAYDDYIMAVRQGKERFDGIKVRGIIDDFGGLLTTHLTDEIETLLRLEEHSEKIDWHEYHTAVQKKAVAEGDPELELPCIITNLEAHWEGGIHDRLWPPLPRHVLLLFRWWYIPRNKDVWRFSSCDSHGRPKDLPFV